MNLPLYALDIETDTSKNTADDPDASLNSTKAGITSIAVYGHGTSLVIDDTDERRLLHTVNVWLMNLPAGVVVTWNGSGFDLPYIADRAALHKYDFALAVAADPALVPKYQSPNPAHTTGYRGRFGKHLHADIQYAYKVFAEERGIRWSLKPVCEAAGITMITVDRERMHDLTVAERMAYNLSDTVGTHGLTEMLGDSLSHHIDPDPETLTA